jgi:hypothetical protein
MKISNITQTVPDDEGAFGWAEGFVVSRSCKHTQSVSHGSLSCMHPDDDDDDDDDENTSTPELDHQSIRHTGGVNRIRVCRA